MQCRINIRLYVSFVIAALIYVCGVRGQSLDLPTHPAFHLNILKDIPSAMPTEEITFINAPTANNQGTAQLFYEIKIPPGRQGMEPDVVVEYNSEHGMTWCGQGWDVDLPAITLDTRWGVPRYDANVETETYLIEGQQMAPVAHRSTPLDRVENKQFYLRVEDRFDKMIRHGNGPTNYWWEIVSTEGIRRFFGGHPDHGVDQNAILTDQHGNIAHWAFVQKIDLNGNTIHYTYSTVIHSGTPGASTKGKQIYPKEITYTGFNDQPGPFSISFIRDRQLGESERMDIGINARLGFKQVAADLLRKIEIKYNGQMVRAYDFKYETGAFHKTLLKELICLDENGEEFYRHAMDYYDDVRINGDYYPFANRELWAGQNDQINGGLVAASSLFPDDGALLGGSYSSDWSLGGAATVGLIGDLLTKTNTVGANYNYGKSDGEGRIAFVDINGDGLADKVYRKNGQLFYRANQHLNSGSEFGTEKPILGISQFSKATTTSHAIGAEAHPGLGFVGYTNNKITTNVTTYFSDFNGDGLIDVVFDGTVYFNHIDAQGNPAFTTQSEDTPSPIKVGAGIDPNLIVVDVDVQEAQIDASPLHDVVRMWEAPYDGFIRITAPVRLLEDPSPESQAYQFKDGVRVAIQVRGEEQWSSLIGPDDFTTKTPSALNNIPVDAGDRIYFRVQSNFDGAYDQVIWDPIIEYVGENTMSLDPTSKPFYSFKASDDFLLASCQNVTMPLDGIIDINGTITKPILSDNIVVRIIRENLAGNTDVLSQSSYSYLDTVDVDLNFNNLAVDSGDVLYFRIDCSTNVEWSAVEWTPVVSYQSANNGAQVLGQNGERLVTFCPAPEYQIYSQIGAKTIPYSVPESGELEINERLGFNLFPSGGITLSVKKEKELIAKEFIAVAAGAPFQNNPLTIQVTEGDILFIEYHATDAELGAFLNNSRARLTLNGQNETIDIGFHSKRIDDDVIFGPMYRNWGLFAYNGNRDRADNPINEDELEIDESAADVADGAGDIDDPDDIGSTYSSANEPFILLVSDIKNRYWIGSDNLTYVRRDTISSSRMGEDNVLPLTFNQTGGILNMPPIKSVSHVNSVAGGVSVGPAGAGGSVAFNKTHNEIDVLDLNGDNYPDIVTDAGFQYTNMCGGLEETFRPHSFQHHEARSFAWGISTSVDFVNSSATNSGNSSQGQPSGAKRGALKSKGSQKTKTASKSRRGGAAKSTVNKSSKKSKDASRASQNGIGIDVGFTSDRDSTTRTWADINGDGLIDMLYDDGSVALNLGYEFTPRENWGFSAIRGGLSQDYGGGLGINLFNGSIVSGLSINRTDNQTEVSLQDVNGDGMVDLISGMEPLTMQLNTGNGFAPAVKWYGSDYIEKGSATGESVNVAFTVCIPIIILGIKICVNPSSSIGQGMSRVTQQLADADGDGFIDYLESTNDRELFVRKSTIGRTNLLKSVQRPLGGTVTMDYVSEGNDYDLPFSRWVLNSVEEFDGVPGDGADRTKVVIEYDAGRFDRHEREFYGFNRVIVHELNTQENNAVYRSVHREFSIANYYEKGRLLSYRITDARRRPFFIETNTYQLIDVLTGAALPSTAAQDDAGMAFPALRKQILINLEGDTTSSISTINTFTYDLFGNIVRSIHLGDGTPEDELIRDVEYHHDIVHHFHQTPAKETWSANGNILRQTIQKADQRGNVIQKHEWLAENELVISDFTHDEYGNITSYERPINHKGQRLTYEYTYDSLVHAYISEITDSYGLTSKSTYDVRYGKLIAQSDINKEKISLKLDNKGRILQIKGPSDHDVADDYALVFDYQINTTPASAQTRRYDPEHQADIISIEFSDGFGRNIEGQEAGMVVNSNHQVIAQTIVSGARAYDAFGRSVLEYYPTTQPTGQYAISTSPDIIPPTMLSWDILDRPLTIQLPNGSTSQYFYEMAIDNMGELRQVTIRQDALGHRSYAYHDIKGRVRAKKEEGPFGEIWTNFDYNAISELTKVTDTENHVTTHYYDGLGRQIEILHPDAGIRKYIFDHAGNLIQKISSKISSDVENEGQIIYDHDFERLVEINYPKNYHNKVQLHYGKADAPFYRAGKVWLREDASGGEEIFYGKLGQTEKSIRTILVHRNNMQTYVSEYTYDDWGRLKYMTYPDGERVEYAYDEAGKLFSMQGKKSNVTYDYIQQIGYDKFETPVLIHYGNDMEDVVEYDEVGRNLSGIKLQKKGGDFFSSVTYVYDSIDNITSQIWESSASDGNLGGLMQCTYQYDKLGRLSEAIGQFSSTSSDEKDFALEMVYDDLHNIISKKMEVQKQGQLQQEDSYENNYNFEDSQPHAPSKISGRALDYDPTGNLIQTRDITSFDFRQLKWDEENRLMAVSNNGYISKFTYDGQGERIISSHGGIQGVFIDGETAGIVDHVDNYTINVSPFFTIEKNEFKKHYFIQGRRFLTKKGNGRFNFDAIRIDETYTAGQLDYLGRRRLLELEQDEYYKSLGIAPGAPTLIGLLAQPEFAGNALPSQLNGDYGQIPPGWPRAVPNRDTTGAPGPPILFEHVNDSSFVLAPGYAFDSTGISIFIETDVTYYHQDHLGTAHAMTDYNGKVKAIRHFAPFGELFAEQKREDRSVIYQFNGKKYDEHTGLYYFGARYFDPKYSMWVNVDPFVNVFPSWSPYAYTFHNPLNYVDGDGKLPGAPYLSPDQAAKSFSNEFNPASIAMQKELASTIYYDAVGGYYSYTSPVLGTEDGVDPPPAPNRTRAVADVHTHAQYSPKYRSDVFSQEDIDGIRADGHVGYVATPYGRLLKFDPFDGPDGTISTISRKIPADPNHPKVRRSKSQQKQFGRRTKTTKYKKVSLLLGGQRKARY